MNESIGSRITRLRKENNLTQDQLAQALDISPQAISKWENDLTCPDITLLPKISEILHISIDELLTGEASKIAIATKPEIVQNMSNMHLKVRITQKNGKVVKVNVPIKIVKTALKLGGSLANSFTGDIKLDVDEILQAIESGITGKIVDITTENDEHVEVFIE